MPTIWKTDASPPATALRILADMLSVQHDCIDVDFIKMEHKDPDYVKLNPLGTVPFLKDGDFFLADSHAQMKYLLGKYGTKEQQEALYPSDLKAQAIVDQAMFFDTGVFFIKVKIIALPTLFEDMSCLSEKHAQEIQSTYGVVEAYLANKQFVAANHLSLADLSLGCTAFSLDSIVKVDKDQFPKTAAWMGRLMNIPEYKKYIGGVQSLGDILRSVWARRTSK